MSAKSQPIIVIKKMSGHGGSHGGAWKVAYADFVTAMMSLFIVLWLMGSSSKVKQAVAGYFNDPKGTGSKLGTTMSGTGETITAAQNDQMQKLKDKLEAEIKAKKELEKLSKQIEITITAEGLRIELIEDKNGVFYQSGSPKLSGTGQELLTLLATELKTLPNSLLIEGHTDATQYSTDANYSNWELSADRANSARRLLQQDGVRSDQVTQVRGYADQFLRVKNDPYDPSNRRISILVKNGNDGRRHQASNMPRWWAERRWRRMQRAGQRRRRSRVQRQQRHRPQSKRRLPRLRRNLRRGFRRPSPG
jgi:chemotaxis protein MotB